MFPIVVPGLRYELTRGDLRSEEDKAKTSKADDAKTRRHNVKFLELFDKVGAIYLFRVRLEKDAEWCRLISTDGKLLRLRDNESISVSVEEMRRLTAERTFRLIRDEPVAIKWDPKSDFFPLS